MMMFPSNMTIEFTLSEMIILSHRFAPQKKLEKMDFVDETICSHEYRMLLDFLKEEHLDKEDMSDYTQCSTKLHRIKQKWEEYEDKCILLHGKKQSWTAISLMLNGRTDDACRQRWMRLTKTPYKTGQRHRSKRKAWTTEEQTLLEEMYALHGPNWRLISKYFPERDTKSVRNRRARMSRKAYTHG